MTKTHSPVHFNHKRPGQHSIIWCSVCHLVALQSLQKEYGSCAGKIEIEKMDLDDLAKVGWDVDSALIPAARQFAFTVQRLF